MHNVGFINIHKKLEGMANNENKNDSNKDSSNCKIPKINNDKFHFLMLFLTW